MTSPGGEWAKARVGVELSWGDLDQELRRRLERSTMIAARAAQRHIDNLRRNAERSFAQMGQSYQRQTDKMVRDTTAAVGKIQSQLSSLRDARVRVHVERTGADTADLRALDSALTRLNRSERINIRVDVQVTGLAQLERLSAALRSLPDRRTIDVDARSARSANSTVSKLSSSMGGLASSIGSALGTLAKFSALAGGLTIAAGAAVGPIAALASAIGAVGVAAAGVGVAGLTAAITGFAALKTGVSGLGDAFSAMGESASSGGGAAVDTAKQVRDAERNLRDAVEAEKDAQKDVARAREDARKKLRDLDLQLRGAALSEKEAAMDLADARDELAAGDFKNSRERQRAILRVQQAELRLSEIQRSNTDLVNEANEARAKGVDGADEVVEAQKRLRQATEQVARAQEAVAEAQKGAAGGGGGADKFAEALAKLSPNARAFVLAIQAVREEWGELRKSVQDRLFAGLAEQIRPLTDNYVPRLNIALGYVADGLNRGAREALNFLNSAEGISMMEKVLAYSSGMAGNLGEAFGNLIPGMTAIAAGAGEVFGPMTQGIAGAATELSNLLIEAQKSGKIAEFFRDGVEMAKQFGAVLGQVGSIIGGVFQAAQTASGGNIMGGWLQSLQTISAWVHGEGQAALVSFFQSMSAAMGAVMPVILQIAGVIGSTLAPILAGLLVQIGPGLSVIVDGLGQAFQQLAPAAVPIGAAINAIATSLGPVLPLLGQLIAQLATIAGPIVAALAQALGPVIQTVGTVLLTALQSLTPLIGPITDVILQMAPVIQQLATFIGSMLVTALQVAVPFIGLFLQALQFILPVAFGLLEMLQPLAPVIGAVAGAVMVAVGAFKVFQTVTTIIKAVKTAWQLLSLAFTMSPIGLLLTALVALGAGLYLFFTKTETGRRIWDTIWNGIKATWDAVWPYIKQGFETLGQIALWLWQNAIQPAFSFIGQVIQVAWSIIQVIFQAWLNYIQMLGNIALWLWNNVIVPAFNGIRAVIQTAINIVIGIFNGFVGAIQTVGQFFVNLAGTLRDAAGRAKDWIVEKFNAVVDFFRGLPDKIKEFAGKIWAPIENAAKTVFNSIAKLWNNTVGKLSFTIPDIPGMPGRGKKISMPKIPTFAYGGPVRGKGTATSDSILAWLSNGEYVTPAQSVNARTLPLLEAMRSGWTPPAWLVAAALGGGLPGFNAGGRVPYGKPIGYSGPIDDPWVKSIEQKFGITASTYAGHQEKDGQNKGIDWSGPVPNMHQFALWAKEHRDQFEQVIWQNPETGEQVGVADGELVGPGTSQPGYYRDDWAGHQDHVHTRQSYAVTDDGGIASGPGIDSMGASGSGTSLGGGGTPIGSGIGASGSGSSPMWGNSGGGSQYNSAAAAKKAGITPVWVENWPATLGGSQPLADSLGDGGMGGGDLGGAGGGGIPEGKGIGNLTSSSSREEVAEALYWEARKRNYSHDEAVAIVSTAMQESNLNPNAIGGGGAWHGIFQQDSSYPGRDDPNENIKAFLDRLDEKRSSPGASDDIWKNIFWLQQAPGISDAESAYSGGRTAYLDEIKSREQEARELADRFAQDAPPAQEVPPVEPSTTPSLTPTDETPSTDNSDLEKYNVGDGTGGTGGTGEEAWKPEEWRPGGTISSMAGSAAKTGTKNAIDEHLYRNRGALGNYDNSKGTSLGERAGGVLDSAIQGQLGAALDVFGLNWNFPLLDAIGQYMQDNQRQQDDEQKNLQDLVRDLAQAAFEAGTTNLILPPGSDGEDARRRVEQDRRRRVGRYVKW